MTPHRFQCLRCHLSAELPPDAAFCPRCGLSMSAEPEVLQVGSFTLTVGAALATGGRCNLYYCTAETKGAAPTSAVFKIARDDNSRLPLQNEAAKLTRLNADARLRPFIPRVLTALQYRSTGDTAARPAEVLVYHDDLDSPAALYSLDDVRRHYPNGIDARDMAWMWRRLLTGLAYVHEAGIVHTAISAAHVLIEPNGHKLVLIGWSSAKPTGSATVGLDLQAAARTMLSVMGQDLPTPPPIDPAVKRHFDRALQPMDSLRAMGLLDDFDKLIEVLWGPRTFRPFAMPAGAKM